MDKTILDQLEVGLLIGQKNCNLLIIMDKKMTFSRDIAPVLDELANIFAVVSITGPRQSGKTTLAKSHFPDKAYFNLEDPSMREKIMSDPKSILASVKQTGAIFDEVQHCPELLSYLQAEVDETQAVGQFIITGSYNLALMSSVTQSLAGRVGILELLPLSLHELKMANIKLSVDEAIYTGGLPKIFKEQHNPTLIYRHYLKTYVERDMRNLININDLSQFQRFMQLCASRVGSEFVASNLANEIGVSYHTIQAWLSVLEVSYIVFRLPPFFENFGKRIVKSSKLYFSDVGLACYLLGIETPEHVSRDPLRGNLFENLVVLDCYKHLLNQGKDARLYFYRDRAQKEIDLIWQRGRELIPIEIKLGQTYQTSFVKGLTYFKQLANQKVPEGYVIYTGETQAEEGMLWKLINYQDCANIFK